MKAKKLTALILAAAAALTAVSCSSGNSSVTDTTISVTEAAVQTETNAPETTEAAPETTTEETAEEITDDTRLVNDLEVLAFALIHQSANGELHDDSLATPCWCRYDEIVIRLESIWETVGLNSIEKVVFEHGAKLIG